MLLPIHDYYLILRVKKNASKVKKCNKVSQVSDTFKENSKIFGAKTRIVIKHSKKSEAGNQIVDLFVNQFQERGPP